IEQCPGQYPDRSGQACHTLLSRGHCHRTSARVTRDLFDRKLRALRRDRAAAMGPELFLLDRAFDDCLDRLRAIAPKLERALLIGSPSPSWSDRLGAFVDQVDVVDPGRIFASEAGGTATEEDRFDFGESSYDLCLAVGTLDTVNELPLALQMIHRSLRPDGLLVGAIAGGNSLPALRAALIEGDRQTGRAVARTHPRIEPASLAGLLTAAGFAMPVVDVDRISLRYSSLGDLVRDLRAMGATGVLAERPPPLSKAAARRAAEAFGQAGSGGRTEELVEILHFLGWSQFSKQAAG
ncbi:MAG: methyltransferase domain-containing protein, partial [Sphingomicrobium sp.]